MNDVNDVNDTIVRLGRRGAPVLVVAGSLGADETAWTAQFDAWAPSHDIVFVRHPGHGGRPVQGAGPAALHDMAADLLAALDAAGVQEFDFVGLSLGAMVGLQLAAGGNPRLRRLVACCCRWWQPPELAAEWDARIAAVAQHGMAAVAQPTIERWLSAGFRARQPQTANALLATLQATQPAGYAHGAAAVRDGDLRERLQPLGARALVLSGADDAAAPAAHMAGLAAALDCAHTVLPQCAHLPNVERPDLFNAAVAGWLA